MRQCSVEGCNRLATSRRLCDAHYQRWNRVGDTMDDVPIRLRVRDCHRFKEGTKCKSPICHLPVHCKGLCEPHYRRMQRTGDAKINKPVSKPSWIRKETA